MPRSAGSAKDDPAIGGALGRFLASAYDKKQIADYATDKIVDPAEAGAVIEQAAAFLEAITAALGADR